MKPEPIVERVQSPTTDARCVRAFMTDLMNKTLPDEFDDKNRIFNDTVLIRVRPDRGFARLDDISVLDHPRSGHGTAALKFLISLADQHSVTLIGTALAQHSGGPTMSTARLLQWYEKHGFRVSSGSDSDGYPITRTPHIGEGCKLFDHLIDRTK